MNTERFAAKGLSAFIWFLLLVLPPAICAEEIHRASLVEAETLNSGTYSERLSIRIGNRVENLLLNQHPHLNGLRIIDGEGRSYTQQGIAYSGIVESLASSWARVFVDGNFISGTISTGTDSVHFSSDLQTDNLAHGRDQTLNPPTLLKRQTANTNESSEEIVVPVDDQFLELRGDITRVARIGLVVDSLYDEAIGGRGLSKAISTINSVDGLYRANFGLALKVEVVLLVTDEDPLALNGATLEENLSLFRDYRMESEQLDADLGLVHLFTGIASADDAVGLAYKGAACRTDGYDVSISRPFRFPVRLAAHEIGHNLGASHDDETTECQGINDRLMYSQINSVTTQEFSSCSKDSINTRLQQSACHAAAIDIGLTITQLESNQILATINNYDATRAFPAAVLNVELKNASIAEAPAICELDAPTKLTCSIPATYAGDTQELAIKLRLDPDEKRTVNVWLEPVGFFDLSDGNNAAELIIPGEPQPLASTGGEITTQGGQANGGSGGNGGGVFGSPLLFCFFTALLLQARRRLKS